MPKAPISTPTPIATITSTIPSHHLSQFLLLYLLQLFVLFHPPSIGLYSYTFHKKCSHIHHILLIHSVAPPPCPHHRRLAIHKIKNRFHLAFIVMLPFKIQIICINQSHCSSSYSTVLLHLSSSLAISQPFRRTQGNVQATLLHYN